MTYYIIEMPKDEVIFETEDRIDAEDYLETMLEDDRDVYLVSDEDAYEPSYDIEMGFNSYMGCYDFDC